MKTTYDTYYQTEDLFGKIYPELIKFFKNITKRGKLLDLGCGQGRDAVPLAELGYEVTGIDISKVGIEQMIKKGKDKNLNIRGIATDIYKYENFDEFDFILLNSMFHFEKNDKEKEINFIKKIIHNSKSGTIINFCIQNSGEKVNILNETIASQGILERINETDFIYESEYDNEIIKTTYQMIAIKK